MRLWPRKPWSRFLSAFAASTIAAAAAGIAVNYLVDVAHVYRANSSARTAFIKTYVAGLNATKAGRPLPAFERDVKRELVEDGHADCFVTGSSHELKISRAGLPALKARCRTLVNVAVSGGSFEDFVTMAALLAQRRETRRIYIGISPWFFRPDADSRYKTDENGYAEARRFFGLADHEVRTGASAKLFNLINGQYFARNVSEVARNIEARMLGMHDPNDREKDWQMLQPDGSVTESKADLRRLKARKVSDIGPTQKDIGTYKFEGQKADAAQIRDFKTIVAALQQRHIAVAFVLSPYHPSVWACNNAAICQWLEQMEQHACAIAGELHVHVIGGFRPAPFGLTWRDFTDDHHVMRASIPHYWRAGCGAEPDLRQFNN
jgi:hypothetical protein